MTATSLLTQLESKGIIVTPTGDRLHLAAAPGVITEDVKSHVRQHKPALLELLGATSLFAHVYAEADEAVRYALDERAAILQFDANLPRHEAEERAAREWRNSHEI